MPACVPGRGGGGGGAACAGVVPCSSNVSVKHVRPRCRLLCRPRGGGELCSSPAGREVGLCSRACLLSLRVCLAPATGTVGPGAALVKTPFCRGRLSRPIKRMELHLQLCPADRAGEAARTSASSFASVHPLPKFIFCEGPCEIPRD